MLLQERNVGPVLVRPEEVGTKAIYKVTYSYGITALKRNGKKSV